MCSKIKDKNNVNRGNIAQYSNINESINQRSEQKPPIQTTKVRDLINEKIKK